MRRKNRAPSRSLLRTSVLPLTTFTDSTTAPTAYPPTYTQYYVPPENFWAPPGAPPAQPPLAFVPVKPDPSAFAIDEENPKKRPREFGETAGQLPSEAATEPLNDDLAVTATRAPKRRKTKATPSIKSDPMAPTTAPKAKPSFTYVEEDDPGFRPAFSDSIVTGPRVRRQSVFHGRANIGPIYDDGDDEDDYAVAPVRRAAARGTERGRGRGRPRRTPAGDDGMGDYYRPLTRNPQDPHAPQDTAIPVEPITELNTGPQPATFGVAVPREIVEVPEVDPIPEEIITLMDGTTSYNDSTAEFVPQSTAPVARPRKPRTPAAERQFTPGERKPRAKLQEGVYKGGELLKKIFTRKKDISTNGPISQSPSGAKRVPSQTALLNPNVYIKADVLPPLWDGLREDWSKDHSDYAGSAVVVKNPFWLGNVWISASVSDLIALAPYHFECVNLAIQLSVMQANGKDLSRDVIQFVHSSDFSQYYQLTQCETTGPQIVKDVKQGVSAAVYIPVELAKNLMGLVLVLPRWNYVVCIVPGEPNQTPAEQQLQLDKFAEEEHLLRIRTHQENLRRAQRTSPDFSTLCARFLTGVLNGAEKNEAQVDASGSEESSVVTVSTTTTNSSTDDAMADLAASGGLPPIDPPPLQPQRESTYKVAAQWPQSDPFVPSDGPEPNVAPPDASARSSTAVFLQIKDDPYDQHVAVPADPPREMLAPDFAAVIKADPGAPPSAPMALASPLFMPQHSVPSLAYPPSLQMPPNIGLNGAVKAEPSFLLPPPANYGAPLPPFEQIPWMGAVQRDRDALIPVALRRERRAPEVEICPPSHPLPFASAGLHRVPAVSPSVQNTIVPSGINMPPLVVVQDPPKKKRGRPPKNKPNGTFPIATASNGFSVVPPEPQVSTGPSRKRQTAAEGEDEGPDADASAKLRRARQPGNEDDMDYEGSAQQPSRRSHGVETYAAVPTPQFKRLETTTVELANHYASFMAQMCGANEPNAAGVVEPSTWHSETVFLPVQMASQRPVASASGIAVLAWQNTLLQLITSPFYEPTKRFTDIAAAIPKHNAHQTNGSGVWNEVIMPYLQSLHSVNPGALTHLPSLASQPFDDKAVEREWQERILWCIDRYQVDPFVRSTTMLQAPRIYGASDWPFYLGLQAKRGKNFIGPIINVRAELEYIYSSRNLTQASTRGKEVYDRMKVTENSEQGRFACKLFHYAMGMIYVKTNFIWMNYKQLAIKPFSKTGFTITKTFYFYCAQYPQCFLLNYSFGHSTANMTNIHYYLEHHEDEALRTKWKEPVDILEDLENMYATLYAK